MVICQIITSLVYGGAEKLLVNFINELIKNENEIHVIYLKGDPKLMESFNSRVNLYHVPLGFSCASQLSDLVKSLKADVIHTHLGHADLIGIWATRKIVAKRFCTMHNVYFRWNWQDKIFFFLYYLTFKYWGKDVKISCISNAVARHVNHTLRVPLTRIRVDPNCIPMLNIEISKENARRQLGLQRNTFCVLTIGRMRVQKSMETLILAVRHLINDIPNLRVLIVGEGEKYDSLKQLVHTWNLNKYISFEGVTNNPELFLAASDVFALTSVFEGLPTVILEAFRSSLPVVASKIDGISELIKDGENGLLFEVKNDKELAKKLQTLYESPELRNEIGLNGQSTFVSNYSIDKYTDRMRSLYMS